MYSFFLRISLFCVLSFILMQNAYADNRMQIFVSILPQKYFVEQIGKDLVDVHVMVEPGADPHTYEPKPRQMAALSTAKLYFAIGVEFEKARLEKIISLNRGIKVVHMDYGINKLQMSANEGHETDKETHIATGHESDNHHELGSPDPHIWLSPPLVILQSRVILKAFKQMDPAHGSIYENNYKAFISRLVDLDMEIMDLFKGSHDMSFMVFHPSWGYFADAYGLTQIPVEVEGKDPKPAQLKGLIVKARKQDIKVIFVQPQFSKTKAELIAREINGQVVFVDPLAEDWMTNLREVASKFKKALK